MSNDTERSFLAAVSRMADTPTASSPISEEMRRKARDIRNDFECLMIGEYDGTALVQFALSLEMKVAQALALQDAESRARAIEWQPIDTAPKDGTVFLATQDDEIYCARFIQGRLAFRTHALRCPERHRVIDAEMDGKPVKARVLEESGPETFEHNWTYWTRGFEFTPTRWMPLSTRETPDGK